MFSTLKKRYCPPFEQTGILFTQGCVVPSLVKNDK